MRNNPDSFLCKTSYFIVPAIANQLVNVVFFIVGFGISKTIKAQNRAQIDLMKGEEPEDQIYGRKQIAMRTKSLRDLWVIIISLFICDLYATLYSLILLIFSDDDCYISDDYNVRSFFTIFTRYLSYIFWTFPVMWAFWPK